MAPPGFGDLSKSANDLFSKDYTVGAVKAEIKTSTKTGIELKTNGNHDIETGRASADLETKYVFKEHGLTFTEKWKTSNVISTEFSVEDKILKGLKQTLETSFEPNSGNKNAKVKNSFKNNAMNVSCDLEFKRLKPLVNAAAVFSVKDFFVGVNAGFDSDSQKLTKLNYGLLYQTKDFSLYGGVENGTNYLASVYQKISNSLETGVKLSWASNTHVTNFGVASKYKLDDKSFAKVKVDNNSMLGLAYSFAVNDGMRLTLCGNVDGKNINGGGHRLGMSLNFES